MAKVLSMEIGYSRIKIVEMDFHQKKPKIYKCLECETPEGAVKDGYINPAKTEELKERIRETLKKNKVRTKRVIFTVFSGKIISREVTLPNVKEHQIGAMIESNVNEYFPIELDDYKIAHLLIQTYREGENEGKHKVLVMAAERTLLAGYERLADELGLLIMDIDYSGNSVIQATKLNAGAEAIMVVKAENEWALVTILHQGMMVMQRTVNYRMAGMDDDTPVTHEEMIKALTGTVTRVIDFYAANNGERHISQIYLVGEGTRTDALMHAMAEQTGINCRMLEHVRGVSYSRQADNAKINLYAAVIGAGISSVGFDAEKQKERHETNYTSACVLMIILCILLVGAMLSLSLIPYYTQVQEQAALQRKQEQLEPARIVHDQYLGLTDFIAQLRYGNRLTEHFNDGIISFLEELENKLPTDIEVTDFSSDDEMCVMTVRIGDKETAAGIINMLRGFESLESVTVESLVEEVADDSFEGILDDISKGEEVKTVNFTVTCIYKAEIPEAPVPLAQPAADTTLE